MKRYMENVIRMSFHPDLNFSLKLATFNILDISTIYKPIFIVPLLQI